MPSYCILDRGIDCTVVLEKTRSLRFSNKAGSILKSGKEIEHIDISDFTDTYVITSIDRFADTFDKVRCRGAGVCNVIHITFVCRDKKIVSKLSYRLGACVMISRCYSCINSIFYCTRLHKICRSSSYRVCAILSCCRSEIRSIRLVQ